MTITRWWQLEIGVFVGPYLSIIVLRFAFLAIVLGLVLALASLRSGGDDAMTAGAAGFLTGVLGVGIWQVSSLLFGSPFA